MLYSRSRREKVKGLVGQKYPKNKLVLSKSRALRRKITELPVRGASKWTLRTNSRTRSLELFFPGSDGGRECKRKFVA